MTDEAKRLTDRIVHEGRPDRVEPRHVNMPMELCSTMVFDTMAGFDAARANRKRSGQLYYGRYGTGASYKLEEALATLDGAEGATLASSGVAAISMTLSALTRSGAHALVADNVYGNTRAFCDEVLTRQGVSISYFDPMLGGDVADLMRPETTVVMFEAPGSGTFETPDIPAIAAAARAGGAVSVLDATWPSPVFLQPLSLGVDVAVSSGSKYLSGHSDCMIGVIVARDPHHQRIRDMVFAYGDKPGAQEVFLALRGLRTLEMRMRHADQAGRAVAAWLAERPEVARVLHPAFEACPGHAHWARDFSGAAGLFGVVLRPCSDAAVHRFVDALRFFGIGVSWGGFESLVLPVKPTRTARLWTEPGQLIRFYIGHESFESLTDDLAQGLAHLGET